MKDKLTIDKNARVKKCMERCADTLNFVDNAIAMEYWDFAVNRLYFAVLYSANALFEKNDIQIKSLRFAKSVLNKHFVIPKILDGDKFRIFSRLEKLRKKADYNVLYKVTEEMVMDYRPKAEAFIETVKKCWKNKILPYGLL